MSLAASWPEMTKPWPPLAVPAVAIGASFTGVTVRLTVAVLESTCPSLALKVKVSGPL